MSANQSCFHQRPNDTEVNNCRKEPYKIFETSMKKINFMKKNYKLTQDLKKGKRLHLGTVKGK